MQLPNFSFQPTQEQWISASLVWGATILLAVGLRTIVKILFKSGDLPNRAWAKALRRPISNMLFFGVLLVGTSIAVKKLGIEEADKGIAIWIDRIFQLAWILYMISSGIRFSIAWYRIEESRSDHSNPGHLNRIVFFRRMVVGVAIVLGFLLTLRVFGVDTGPFLAGGALGGVVLGLALQESLSNVFSGMLFTWDAAVRIGDLVLLPDGREGFVEQIGWRTTTVRLHNNTLLVVPNSKIAGDIVVNLSRPEPLVTVNVDCSVSYSADLDEVEAIIIDITKAVQEDYKLDRELKEPFVRWRDFSDSGITFRAFMPISSVSDQYASRSNLVKAIHRTFKEKGIEIPFPVRNLHLLMDPANKDPDISLPPTK